MNQDSKFPPLSEINSTDNSNRSLLWFSSKNGNEKLVEFLVENGANVDQRDVDGTTALYQSCYFGHLKIVEILLKHGASVNLTKNSGASPIFVAARNGHSKIVEILLKNGADPLRAQNDGRSTLQTALVHGRAETVRQILPFIEEKTFDQRDNDGWNNFHFLAKKSCFQTAKIFFDFIEEKKFFVDFRCKDRFGNTPILIALFYGQNSFAEFLTSKGFDPSVKNDFNWNFFSFLDFERSKNEQKEKKSIEQVLAASKLDFDENSEENSIRIQIESILDEMKSFFIRHDPMFAFSIVQSGSFFERTKVVAPDEFDYMFNLDEFCSLTKIVSSNGDPVAHFRLAARDESQETHLRLINFLDAHGKHLSSEKVRKRFHQIFTAARSDLISRKFQQFKIEWTNEDKRCGTGINLIYFGRKFPVVFVQLDLVPCVFLDSPSGKEAKVFLIARSPEEKSTSLWRFSTSLVEQKYFTELLDEKQIRVYLFLKILKNRYPATEIFSKKTDVDHEHLLTSYMIKNVFLAHVERFPSAELWQNQHLFLRIEQILQDLIQLTEKGFIPSVFFPNYNVIDEKDYRLYRDFQIQYLRYLEEKFHSDFY